MATQIDSNMAYPELIWAGTEHSLQIAVQAHRQIEAGIFSARRDEEEEIPYMFSKQGHVGVISVRGPMVNRDSPYNRYFGVSSYADIRRALMYAVEDAEVSALMLDIDSGGGAVSGLADTADLVALIDKGVKPVFSYGAGTMASAAYWLGASGRKVYAGKTSLVGSIGVIATHMEYSKLFKEAGIGVNVVRAGKYKALLNMYEPATEAALKQLEDQLDAAYDIFIGFVADRRGVSKEQADSKMGQGREFFGKAAQEAGLVDGISTFDAAMSIVERIALDKRKVTQNNIGNVARTAEMPKALTENQVAALQAGLLPDDQVQAVTAGAPEAQDDPETQVENTPQPDPVAETKPDATVEFYKAQLAEANQKIVDVTVDLREAKATADAMKATHTGLFQIACKSLSNMKVALGMPAADLTKLSAEAVLADHAATSEAFLKAFKAGGVAAVTAAKPEKSSAPHPSVHKARVDSTRLI